MAHIRPALQVKCAPFLLLFLLGCPIAKGETFKPTNPDQVLETLTRSGLNAGLPQELRSQRAALRKNPDQLDLAIALTDEMLRLGRRTSDPRFYGEAEAILKPWWDKPQPPSAVLFRRANILQFNHRFDDALKDLDSYLKTAPDDLQARLMEATVLQVTGRYPEARRSCESIPPRRFATYRLLCLSSAMAMIEDPRPIYANLRGMTRPDPAASPLKPASKPNPEELFALSVTADLAVQLNDAQVAIETLKRILAAEPNDVYATITLADLLLDQGKFAEVQSLTCPSQDHDGFLLRCTRALRSGDPKRFADLVATLEQRIEAERRRGSPAHLREIAYFYLFLKDSPNDALASAIENYKTQKEPIDTRLLLEAAAAQHDMNAAAPALQWVKSARYQYDPFTQLSRKLGGVP